MFSQTRTLFSKVAKKLNLSAWAPDVSQFLTALSDLVPILASARSASLTGSLLARVDRTVSCVNAES